MLEQLSFLFFSDLVTLDLEGPALLGSVLLLFVHRLDVFQVVVRNHFVFAQIHLGVIKERVGALDSHVCEEVWHLQGLCFLLGLGLHRSSWLNHWLDVGLCAGCFH